MTMFAHTPPRIGAAGLGVFSARPQREWHSRQRLVRHLSRGCQAGRCDRTSVLRAAEAGDENSLRDQARSLTRKLLEPFARMPRIAGVSGCVQNRVNRPARARWLREAVRLGLVESAEVYAALQAGDEAMGALVGAGEERLKASLTEALRRFGPEAEGMLESPPRLRFAEEPYSGANGWMIDLQGMPMAVSVGTALDHSPALAHAVSTAFQALSVHVVPLFGPEEFRDLHDGFSREDTQSVLDQVLADLGAASAAEVDRDTLAENVEQEYGFPFSAVEALLDGRMRDKVAAVHLTGQSTTDAAHLRKLAQAHRGTAWSQWIDRVAGAVEANGGQTIPMMYDLNYWMPTARIVHFDRDEDEYHFLDMAGQEIEPTMLAEPSLEELRSLVVGITWVVTLTDEAASIDSDATESTPLAEAA